MTDSSRTSETVRQPDNSPKPAEMTTETIDSELSRLETVIDWTSCITGQLPAVQRYYQLTTELATRNLEWMPACRHCGAPSWQIPARDLVECHRCGALPWQVYRSVVHTLLIEADLGASERLHTVAGHVGATTTPDEWEIPDRFSREYQHCGWCDESLMEAAISLDVVTIDHSPRVCQECVAQAGTTALRQALAAMLEPFFGRLLSEVPES